MSFETANLSDPLGIENITIHCPVLASIWDHCGHLGTSGRSQKVKNKPEYPQEATGYLRSPKEAKVGQRKPEVAEDYRNEAKLK